MKSTPLPKMAEVIIFCGQYTAGQMPTY